MVDTAYFTDDHNRLIRVTVFQPTSRVELHILHRPLPDEEGIWVPFQELDPTKIPFVLISTDVEAPGYLKKLTEKAKNCPLFERKEY